MLDALIMGFDRALRTLFASAPTTRGVPGCEIAEADLSAGERRHAGALMRVNHVGEVCAQALYQGQAMTCKEPAIREAMAIAADEETEHLAWTERRIDALGGRQSVLNPLWYLGSLAFGALAGKFGGPWNLGFLAETERQVEAHLDHHLAQLPWQDKRSRAIVEQMKIDEAGHADMAVRLGARELPAPLKAAMRVTARIMTGTAYYF